MLLFGAHGNGNMRGEIQADCLGRSIHEIAHNLRLTATSHLCDSAVNFNYGDVADQNLIMDAEFVNDFDLLIIGGGGLLRIRIILYMMRIGLKKSKFRLQFGAVAHRISLLQKQRR